MPGEFEQQAGMWMLWPERNDNWRDGGKPAQEAFANVAKAIAAFEPVTVCVSAAQYQNCRAKLPRRSVWWKCRMTMRGSATAGPHS